MRWKYIKVNATPIIYIRNFYYLIMGISDQYKFSYLAVG